MSVFDDLRASVASKLDAATVENVTLDPAVTPPAVLVGIPENVSSSALGWETTLPVYLIAPAPGGVDAVDWLLEQLPLALHALRPSATARPTLYPIGDVDCPAYRVDYVATVPSPC